MADLERELDESTPPLPDDSSTVSFPTVKSGQSHAAAESHRPHPAPQRKGKRQQYASAPSAPKSVTIPPARASTLTSNRMIASGVVAVFAVFAVGAVLSPIWLWAGVAFLLVAGLAFVFLAVFFSWPAGPDVRILAKQAGIHVLRIRYRFRAMPEIEYVTPGDPAVHQARVVTHDGLCWLVSHDGLRLEAKPAR